LSDFLIIGANIRKYFQYSKEKGEKDKTFMVPGLLLYRSYDIISLGNENKQGFILHFARFFVPSQQNFK
jgi:hypothetical protein